MENLLLYTVSWFDIKLQFQVHVEKLFLHEAEALKNKIKLYPEDYRNVWIKRG